MNQEDTTQWRSTAVSSNKFDVGLLKFVWPWFVAGQEEAPLPGDFRLLLGGYGHIKATYRDSLACSSLPRQRPLLPTNLLNYTNFCVGAWVCAVLCVRTGSRRGPDQRWTTAQPTPLGSLHWNSAWKGFLDLQPSLTQHRTRLTALLCWSPDG